jgi:hypothetical protein
MIILCISNLTIWSLISVIIDWSHQFEKVYSILAYFQNNVHALLEIYFTVFYGVQVFTCLTFLYCQINTSDQMVHVVLVINVMHTHSLAFDLNWYKPAYM